MTQEQAPTLGRREQKKIAQRERIIEEALQLIELHGIDGMTIDAICDCADIAKKTFYNYYSSKHDLMVDICMTELLNRSTYYRETTEGLESLSEQLSFILQAMCLRLSKATRTERAIIDYMVSSLSNNREQGVNMLTQITAIFSGVFNAQADAIKPEYNVEFCAEMTVGMVINITLNWLNDESYPIETRFTSMINFVKSSMLK